MEILNYVVSDGQSGIRIDRYLSDANEDLSRSYIQKLLKEQKVTVQGTFVKANYKVQAGDVITVEVPDMTEPDILPEDIPLDILYEDEDVLVVNKPKGMVVHPSAGHTTGTLVNAIMAHCKENLSGINGVLRPGIVHRIDKDTTGALLVCKNDNAHRDLALQLKEHSIKRRYRAIVAGVIKEEEGTIEGPIGRHPVDRKNGDQLQKRKRSSYSLQGTGAFSQCHLCGMPSGNRAHPSDPCPHDKYRASPAW